MTQISGLLLAPTVRAASARCGNFQFLVEQEWQQVRAAGQPGATRFPPLTGPEALVAGGYPSRGAGLAPHPGH